jgi:hypothetical protein
MLPVKLSIDCEELKPSEGGYAVGTAQMNEAVVSSIRVGRLRNTQGTSGEQLGVFSNRTEAQNLRCIDWYLFSQASGC